MSYSIISGRYRDYIFLFKECRNAYADTEAKASSRSGKLFFIRDSKMVYGFICLSELSDGYSINYVGVLPDYRGRGLGTMLIEYVKSLTDKISLSVNEDTKSYEHLKPVLVNAGFYISSFSWIFHSTAKVDVFENWFASRGEKLKAMCSILKRQGYQEISFREMTVEQREYLANAKNNDYGDQLDPQKLMTEGWDSIEHDVSFAVYLEGKLVSYIIAVKLGKKAIVFEHISVSSRHIGQGTILLPFVRAMYALREHGYNAVAYKMYGENTRANAFRRKLLGDITASKRRCIDFKYGREK